MLALRSRIRNFKSLWSLWKSADAGAVIAWKQAPTELGESLVKHGSDKASPADPAQSKFSWPTHKYDFVYEHTLRERKREVQNVLEVGIGSRNSEFASNMGPFGSPGASLRAWRDFFPNAKVIGADIDRETFFEEERIHCVYVNQRDSQSILSMWRELGNPTMDVIIDDGEHSIDSILQFAECSIQYLAANGYYFIEDVQLRDLDTVLKGLTTLGLSISVFCFSRAKTWGEMDGCLLLCKKFPS